MTTPVAPSTVLPTIILQLPLPVPHDVPIWTKPMKTPSSYGSVVSEVHPPDRPLDVRKP